MATDRKLSTIGEDPAFSNPNVGKRGLTKREYFAALAMQGMIAKTSQTGDASHIAKTAVYFADFLIYELSK